MSRSKSSVRSPSSRTMLWIQKNEARRHAPGDRTHVVQAARGIEDEVAGGQLHGVHAERVLDHELSSVVLVGLAEEERGGEVGAEAVRRPRHLAHRVVHVGAEGLPAFVAVEERREDAQGQGGGDEQRVPLQRRRGPSRRATRAASEPSGSCWLSLARADWWPAVTRPSTHSARSRMPRASATSSGERTSGTGRSTRHQNFTSSVSIA